MLETISYVLAIAIVANLSITVAVFLQGKRSLHSFLFALLSCGVVAWIFSILGFYFLPTFYSNSIWILFSHSFAAFIALVFLLFALYFPHPLFHRRWILVPLFVAFVSVFFFLFFTQSIIGDVHNGAYEINAGYLFYAAYILSFFFLGFIVLWLQYRSSDSPTQRAQILYIFVGSILSSSLALFTNLILPFLNIFQFTWLGPIFTLILVFSLAIAIFKHHLFDIKVIATELFAFLLALVVFINIFNYGTFSQLFFNILIFLGTSIFGVFLIRSVLWEVKTREELERLAADLSAANEQLTKLDKAKSEFIAIASHQLRTPLTAIKGYISLLMEGTYGVLREKQKKPMNGVFQSAERLIRLVNDLLSISRIESGKIEAKLAATDIKKLVEGVIEELRVKVEGRGLTLDLKNSHETMPTIMADEEKIRNVLMNIIDNAIRYTSKGGIGVYLKLEKAERRIRIAIRDTGEGMTREEMSKLFESFSRGTAGQRIWTEGAGLGLYIAKKFIEMHKGRVWAESEGKGKGSEFVIELPIQ